MFEILLLVMFTTSDGGGQIYEKSFLKTNTESIFMAREVALTRNCKKLGKQITGNLKGRYLSKSYKCIILTGK